MKTRTTSSGVKSSDKAACCQNLTCTTCHKTFKKLGSTGTVLPERKEGSRIFKTTNVTVNLNIQHQRKGFFKWLAGLIW